MLIADWNTKIITVPLSVMTLVAGTRYELSVADWRDLLSALQASDQGIVETVNESLFRNTSPTSTTPRIVDVINGYQVIFEAGLYSMEFVDGNTNIREVEIKTAVSVGTNNTAGLVTAPGVADDDHTVIDMMDFSGDLMIGARKRVFPTKVLADAAKAVPGGAGAEGAIAVYEITSVPSGADNIPSSYAEIRTL